MSTSLLWVVIVPSLTSCVALLGTVVYHNCRAARLLWRQRPGRHVANIQLDVSCRPPVSAINGDRNSIDPPSHALYFMSQPPIPLQPFDVEAQGPPTYPQGDAQPSRNRLDLTATPRVTYLILSPFENGSLERGRDQTRSLGGSIKGEADRRFVVLSSPKKHVRIGRGRNLA